MFGEDIAGCYGNMKKGIAHIYVSDDANVQDIFEKDKNKRFIVLPLDNDDSFKQLGNYSFFIKKRKSYL